MAEQGHKPLEKAPVSGVYEVVHDAHRDPHEATLLEGEVFPACSLCEDRVRFRLKHRAADLHSDKDFPRR